MSAESLRWALFREGPGDLRPADEFSEDDLDWNDPSIADQPAPTQPHPGWTWHQPDRIVDGRSWGGNLEILHWNLAADRWIRPVEDYRGCVLLLETSEEMPAAEEVFRMLRNAGERGLLAQFPAVVVGLAKAANLAIAPSPADRTQFRSHQRAAVLRALEHYNPEAMAVFDVDFGQTDPQLVLPYGDRITVDGPARRITAHY